RTTFEVTTEELGAQNAVAAGGRYDGLVEEFGGPPTPAIGFAVGMERIVTILKSRNKLGTPTPKVFIATIGKLADRESVIIADGLRDKGIWVELGYADNSLRSQLRKADRLGADYVFIIGEDEINSKMLKWKRFSDGNQGEIMFSEIFDFLKVN
ncbi:MAG: His/Gly/Thr/Pro-type tRNA ligase C-terminal domain-containing protein, partial [Nitrospirota bacterium]